MAVCQVFQILLDPIQVEPAKRVYPKYNGEQMAEQYIETVPLPAVRFFVIQDRFHLCGTVQPGVVENVVEK